jgi:putative selenate reductase YgfK subunit
MKGILKGMGVTFKRLIGHKLTVEYPHALAEIPARFRGEIRLRGMIGEENDVIASSEMPPCMAGCPSNVKVREYIALIADGKYVEAVDKVREDNPLPAICGRVCPHPCEDVCRRNEEDEPIAIDALKRFASDYEMELAKKGKILPKKPVSVKNQRIAVIGAGPAGLTVAYYLALNGYKVTIFEKLPVAGGMLKVGIPDYRLPADILQAEIDSILNLGVELKLNTEVNSIEDLFKDGFDIVFIGVGAHLPQKLGIEGEDIQGMIPGEGFLMDVALGKKVDVKGKKIAVIGGGNTAIDCARTSLREGAEEVSIVYRRTRKEMPAHEIEIEDAEEEGVKMEYLVAPVKAIGKDGKLVRMECVRMELGEPDKSGRRRPVPVKGSEFVIDVDVILTAISRIPDIGWLKDSGIEISRWGTISSDLRTGETSRERVYTAGDVNIGAATVIEAIAGAKRAARAIDKYLSGSDTSKIAEKFTSDDCVMKPTYLDEKKRAEMSRISLEKRAKGYDEVDLGLIEELALREAKRCLSCRSYRCVGCGICRDICPDKAISLDIKVNGERKIDDYEIALDRCMFCGICVEYCPTEALIHTTKFELADHDREKLFCHKKKLLGKE